MIFLPEELFEFIGLIDTADNVKAVVYRCKDFPENWETQKELIEATGAKIRVENSPEKYKNQKHRLPNAYSTPWDRIETLSMKPWEYVGVKISPKEILANLLTDL